jgi:anti-sigma B factor antagonist
MAFPGDLQFKIDLRAARLEPETEGIVPPVATREDLFLELAVKAKFLTPAQIEDCRKLQDLLSQNGFTLPLREIVGRKEFITPDQLRVLNMAIRYEEQRADDRAFGEFILKKGFLKPEQLSELQTMQDAPYREGRHFPRIEDLAVQRGYLTPQQLHVLLRAREQLDAPEPAAAGPAGSSPRIPILQPAIPPPQGPPPARSFSPGDLKALESGLSLEALKVTYRKVKVRDGGGPTALVHVLELDGVLDGYTSKKFEAYVSDLQDAGGIQIVFACPKLDYLSSAGIGVLTGATKRARDLGGDVRLSGISDKVSKIMGLIGLPSLLRTYDGDKGAVMSFKYA